MRNLLLKRRRGFFSPIFIFIFLCLVGVVFNQFNQYYARRQQAADAETQTAVTETMQREAAFDELVFEKLPKNLPSGSILKQAALATGIPIPLLPRAVSAHFFESPRRVLSFIFLLIIFSGIIQLFYKFLNSIGITALFHNLTDNDYDKGREKGYNVGYRDGKRGLYSYDEAYLLDEKYSISLVRILVGVIPYLILIVVIMLVMASEPEADLKTISINHEVTASPAAVIMSDDAEPQAAAVETAAADI